MRPPKTTGQNRRETKTEKHSVSNEDKAKLPLVPEMCFDACDIILSLPYDFPEHEEYDNKMNLREFNMLHSQCLAMKQSQLDLQKSDAWEN